MQRLDGKTMLLLVLPSLALLVFGLSSSRNWFRTRPAFYIVRNELKMKANGKPRHEVEFEVRCGSWLERQIRREPVMTFQTFDSSCVDSKSGKIWRDYGGGAVSTTKERINSYAIYHLKDLRKSSGDLKLTMTLSYLDGKTWRTLPVRLIVPRSKLQQ